MIFVLFPLQLWVTKDFGETWTVIQEMVKSFYWTLGTPVGPDHEADMDAQGEDPTLDPPTLYVERKEPARDSIVLQSTDLFKSFRITVPDVKDFHVKGDFLFATKSSSKVS